MFLYKLFHDLLAPYALSVDTKMFKDLYYDGYYLVLRCTNLC